MERYFLLVLSTLSGRMRIEDEEKPSAPSTGPQNAEEFHNRTKITYKCFTSPNTISNTLKNDQPVNKNKI
nr:unnamed protein product [Callosobruchus analis]